ncbi:MAG TPA: Pvc16 family protein [Roseiflexaceae bacterium]|nr:Pvc16 family protein [Roseiflexaceae bacterium]
MLSELDETIRQVLITAGGFDPAEVDVSFDIPNRAWSAGISKPTLNCYLFDIHERRGLREEGWQVSRRGTPQAERRPPPLFFEITYLITAWTREVEDEHRLLWHVLRTLMRCGVIPPEHCQGELQQDGRPITTTVAQQEGVLRSPGEFWTALENQLKPSLSFVVTLPVDREPVPAGPPVFSTGIRVRLPEISTTHRLRLAQLFRLAEEASAGGVRVDVEEAGASYSTDAEGSFRLDGLPPGRYTLVARLAQGDQRRAVVVRGPEQPQTTRYSNAVLGHDGRPVAGVTVEVEGQGHSAVTGVDGSFAFEGLPPGRHTLLIHFDDVTQRRHIEIRNPSYSNALLFGGR